MRITVIGRIPSKKNSVMISCRGRFPIKMPSAKYREWHRDASKQIVKQVPFPRPCNVTIEFWFPDKRKTDLSNKAESVMDLLVDNGILSDDNCIEVPKLTLIYRGIDREKPRAEITWQTENSPPS